MYPRAHTISYAPWRVTVYVSEKYTKYCRKSGAKIIFSQRKHGKSCGVGDKAFKLFKIHNVVGSTAQVLWAATVLLIIRRNIEFRAGGLLFPALVSYVFMQAVLAALHQQEKHGI